jgi:DNA repair exonuclease SbcCD ATPase subunit
VPTCSRSSSRRRPRHRPRRPEALLQRAPLRLPALVLSLLALVSPVAGQTLGEAAAREQERRAREGAKASPRPAFTQEDLEAARIAREGPPKPSPSPGAKGSASPKPSPRPTARPSEPPFVPTASREPYWRGRAASARAAITSAEARIKDLEQRLSALRNDLSPTGVQDPNRLQTQQAEMQKVTEELTAAQRELDRARQALSDLEEEARREGALPGWLREP